MMMRPGWSQCELDHTYEINSTLVSISTGGVFRQRSLQRRIAKEGALLAGLRILSSTQPARSRFWVAAEWTTDPHRGFLDACRLRTSPRAPAAGIREASGEETAGRKGSAGAARLRYGDLSTAAGGFDASVVISARRARIC